MTFEYVPLLALQRNLYRIPRGRARFHAYLREMIDWNVKDIKLPLAKMNPAAKEHVPALLDRLLAMNADAAAAEAVTTADVAGPGHFKAALVVADDVAGGWTNRFATEFTHRFDSGRLYDRGWVVGMLWASEAPAVERTKEEIATSIFRLAHVRKHGPAQALRERLAQEGAAMASAGCTGPELDAEDREYTREVIAPYLEATDMRTAIECLFGDTAGATLGFAPRGLSPLGGLALALHDAVEERLSNRIVKSASI
jgi:hypothetical protein